MRLSRALSIFIAAILVSFALAACALSNEAGLIGTWNLAGTTNRALQFTSSDITYYDTLSGTSLIKSPGSAHQIRSSRFLD